MHILAEKSTLENKDNMFPLNQPDLHLLLQEELRSQDRIHLNGLGYISPEETICNSTVTRAFFSVIGQQFEVYRVR
jgi:hypothetical protein